MSYPDLPYIGKLPVPWITRRQFEDPVPLTNVRVIRKRNEWTEKDAWFLEAPELKRDKYGWQWFSERTNLEGRPLWKEVHATRQRRCMDEKRCQVCSIHLEPPFLWLVPEHYVLRGEPLIVVHAPVCQGCLPLAATLCPQVSGGGWVHLTSGDFQNAGAFGDRYDPIGNRFEPGGHYTPMHDDFGLVVARQRSALLIGAEPQPFPSGSTCDTI
jgi:hypothetical protein